MIRSLTFGIAAITVALAGCAGMEREPSRRIVATATLLTPEGAVAGNATLASIGDRYDVHVEVRTLPPGLHGLHLHTTGRCQPKDFSSAGGHLNPFDRKHGTLNPAGSHLGDLPNIQVAADGTGSADALLNGTAAQVEARIFDTDGTALVVHAGPDDYRTDPSGDSGGRIACGVLARVR